MFVDLQEVLQSGLASAPRVSISSVGGRVVGEGWKPTVEEVRSQILNTVGQGSLLTFNNPKGKSRAYFAEKAVRDGHLWALRSFHLSVLYCGIPRTFREALAYCGRFHLSWQEVKSETIAVLATGSLRDWKKYTSHKDDAAFIPAHRELLDDTHKLLHEILPEVFK